jgi:hypothetical protein
VTNFTTRRYVMRAISPIGNYSIQLIEQRVKRGLDRTGTVVEFYDGESVLAQFHRGGLTEWEELAALERFDFSGLPEGVNPLTRVSMFDTEAYVEQRYSNPDERAIVLKEIDERLLHLSTLFPSEFLVVDKPAAVKPWPTYDDTPVEDVIVDGEVASVGIFTMQGITGIKPETIRLYEVENKNRPEVIEAMETLEAELAGVTDGAVDSRLSVSV